MNLKELVCHVRNNILRDGAAPNLWGVDEIVMRLNEAESLFARKTHCLSLFGEGIAELELVQGQDRYTLDKRVVYVYEAEHQDNGQPIRNIGRSKFPRCFGEGRPSRFSLDSGVRVIRFSPTPSEAMTVLMNVAHAPQTKLAQQHDEPVIPDEYHTALADYAAFKLLLNNDPEGGNTVAAGVFNERWLLAVREAKREYYHLRTGPGARAVNNWTFGRG